MSHPTPLQAHAPRHILLANAVRLWAGAERFVCDAAVGLRDRGYQITVQTYPGSPLEIEARLLGLDVHCVDTRADGAPWIVAPLMHWLQHANVDVVLTNYEKDLRTVGWAARLCRRPIAVLHSRECDVPLKNLPHYRFFYNQVAHHILCNSAATRESALHSAPWLDPKRVSVLHKGIDLSPYLVADGREFRVVWGASPNEVLLGFAGQLVPRKRCRQLLEMLSKEPLRARPWRLLIAGRGPEEAALRELTRLLGLSERVIFCGFVADMPAFMRAIDLLVLPSLVEGFGYVLAEAAASGRPVVAYRSSSVPELVSHGETGLLADPAVEESLSAALTRLLDDAKLRLEMGLASQERARRGFSLERMMNELESQIRRTYAHALRGDTMVPKSRTGSLEQEAASGAEGRT